MFRIQGYMSAFRLKLSHERRQNPGLELRIRCTFDHRVDLYAQVVGCCRASTLGIDEITGDRRDNFLGGSHGRPADGIDLFSCGGAVKSKIVVYDNSMDSPHHWRSVRKCRRDVDCWHSLE